MSVDDFLDSEVALAAAATAVLFSPPVRALVRRGAIGGLAGVLTAADTLRSVARVIGHGTELPLVRATSGLQDITERSEGISDSEASGTTGEG